MCHSLLNPLNKLCLGLKYSKVLFLTRVLVTSILSIPKGNSQPSLLLCSSPSRQQGFFTFPFLKLFLHLASIIPHFPSLLPISSIISFLSSLLAPLPLLHIWKLAVPQLILQPSSLLCLLLVLTIKPKLHGLLKDLEYDHSKFITRASHLPIFQMWIFNYPISIFSCISNQHLNAIMSQTEHSVQLDLFSKCASS